MSPPTIGGSDLGGAPDLPTLVVGPSLGTSVHPLWAATVERLTDMYHVIGWDLPGHGSSPPPLRAFTIDDLAAGVVTLVDHTVGARRFFYAGVSVADVRDRLAEIKTPIVAVAGAKDIATPPQSVRFIAANVARGRFVEVADAAHLVPAEQPGRTAEVLVTLRK
ncbi:alpha/beta hydrolase [Mycobacterium heckeshornense]|uniref:Uncharacterized protein n=1 Tax=Mycobacterium heckeshornense TaxID=110505 RepID=A0A2G8B739_9MYCO|nr:alpha/beta hydrolase [Mycobacterium heckeshornense]KMV21062.1 hypothetical protein ACT16_18735 [Mycobacterium heckeshornense]MCV7035974.1 alpha/beta hydrolase [Mycobacterium heckeshornense]PIJ33591.1 alpha/beta hydrolase [Mycobacterium heckeshornense]BCO36683.1 hypothetical protein MHEC_31160 [Mycobacterium heckeshornense]BCQ09576.1 putative aminoacrylate hydrolase RutD [Mycobacterium heckeshornense]